MNAEAVLSDAGLEFPEMISEQPSPEEEMRRRMRGWFKPEALSEHFFEIETPTSVEDLSHERTRQALMKLVFSFKTEGLSFDDRLEYMADSVSTEAAVAFIHQIPKEYRLPKVAPDDEGDIIMVWEGDKTVLLNVEGWTLHFVADPATPNSEHFPEVIFDGDEIPYAFFERLPFRW